jgi:hypothetical protein
MHMCLMHMKVMQAFKDKKQFCMAKANVRDC